LTASLAAFLPLQPLAALESFPWIIDAVDYLAGLIGPTAIWHRE
jgi:hypothetical protein